VIRATARIPGVVVVHDVVDAVDDAGGHGEALAPAFDGERTELISGKNTRAYLGERSYLVRNTTAGKAGTLAAGAAVLARAVVDSAGPQHAAQPSALHVPLSASGHGGRRPRTHSRPGGLRGADPREFATA
jgi:hypothetical protein